ncbi:hypothetical protein Efla_006943 [Eimeria flavescens]
MAAAGKEVEERAQVQTPPQPASSSQGGTGSQAAEGSDIPNVDLSSNRQQRSCKQSKVDAFRDYCSRASCSNGKTWYLLEQLTGELPLCAFKSCHQALQMTVIALLPVAPSQLSDPAAAAPNVSVTVQGESEKALQELFKSNKGVSPGQYFEALAEAIEQQVNRKKSLLLDSTFCMPVTCQRELIGSSPQRHLRLRQQQRMRWDRTPLFYQMSVLQANKLLH